MARLISSNSGLIHVFITIYLLQPMLLYFPSTCKKIFGWRTERGGKLNFHFELFSRLERPGKGRKQFWNLFQILQANHFHR